MMVSLVVEVEFDPFEIFLSFEVPVDFLSSSE